MEEKKKIKLNLNTVVCIIAICVTVVAVGVLVYLVVLQNNKKIITNVIGGGSTSITSIPFPDPAKPIIYLYPTEKKEVSVKLLKEDSITCSYPKYKDSWNVIAKPTGDLEDVKTGRKLYSLYYESRGNIGFKIENDGFVIKGEDSAKFLEDKLNVLGLTEREAEEFIVYWLPKLEANKYNYIRFATKEEINENMPLEINPNPDTIIRVLMIFKGLDNPIETKEQKLEKPERNGFVAVEWGGAEIK